MEQSSLSSLSQTLVSVLECLQLKPDSWTLDFMKILTKVLNNFSKIRQNKKNFRSKGTMCEDSTSFEFLNVHSLTYLPSGNSSEHKELEVYVSMMQLTWPRFIQVLGGYLILFIT
jgi:hypothetical protein